MINRKEIKATAKMRLIQSEPRYWKVMLVWLALGFFLPIVVTLLTSTPLDQWYDLALSGVDAEVALWALRSVGPMVGLALVLSIVLALYQIIMAFGLTKYCLNLHRGEPCGVSTLFAGFGMAGRVLATNLLVVLFTFLWTLLLCIPFLLVIVLAASLPESVETCLILVAYIGFFAAVCAIVLRYAMVNIALADQPELGALDAIRYSKELMRGNRWSYFVFLFSFFGWMLLFALIAYVIMLGMFFALSVSGLIFVLPLTATDLIFAVVITIALLPMILWLTPYMETASVGVYDALHTTAASEEDFRFPPL